MHPDQLGSGSRDQSFPARYEPVRLTMRGKGGLKFLFVTA
jgi:hypothetical protein